MAYPLRAVADAPGGRLEATLDGKRFVLEASQEGRAAVVEAETGVLTLHTFWFAWATQHPDTGIYTP